MEKNEIADLLGKMGVVKEGSAEFDSIALMQDPIVTNRLAVELLQKISPDLKPELVLSPSGIQSYFGYSVALSAWTRFSSVLFDESSATLPLGVSLEKKTKVLLVFDELDVSQAAQMVTLVKDAGAKVSGVLAIRNSIGDAAREFEVLKEAEITTLL